MSKTLRKMDPSNTPMTRGQRRAWLAVEAQNRRRKRASALVQPVPALVLTSDGHGRLTWTLNFTSPYSQINIYMSGDGVTWPVNAYDGWDLGSGNRDCSGIAGYFRICLCDGNSVDVPPYSNIVHSDGL